jgi:hypothetical protein
MSSFLKDPQSGGNRRTSYTTIARCRCSMMLPLCRRLFSLTERPSGITSQVLICTFTLHLRLDFRVATRISACADSLAWDQTQCSGETGIELPTEESSSHDAYSIPPKVVQRCCHLSTQETMFQLLTTLSRFRGRGSSSRKLTRQKSPTSSQAVGSREISRNVGAGGKTRKGCDMRRFGLSERANNKKGCKRCLQPFLAFGWNNHLLSSLVRVESSEWHRHTQRLFRPLRRQWSVP